LFRQRCPPSGRRRASSTNDKNFKAIDDFRFMNDEISAHAAVLASFILNPKS
jgi:hypothetical protein